jgi:hypothetical protein
MDVNPKVGRISYVAFNRNAIVKLLGPIIIDCIDGELPKVMTDGFQRVGGIKVIRAEGRGICSRIGGLFSFHKRCRIWSWGHEGGLGFPERRKILPRGEDTKIDEELAHLFRVDIATVQAQRLYYLANKGGVRVGLNHAYVNEGIEEKLDE